MPLLAGSVVLGPDSPQPVSREDVGTMQATWTAPDGSVWSLTDTSPDLGWFTTKGPSGWGANPIELVTDPLPRGGEQVRFIRQESRRITWPLHIWGDNHQQFTGRYRDLLRAFTMTTHRRTPGILTVYRPDGGARQIVAYYEAGFGGESGENWLSANPVLTLFCPDGYWQDVTPTVVSRAQAGGDSGESSFYSPFINVNSSQVLGRTDIENSGEIEAWPAWVITGPMAKVTAVNWTVGVRFALTYALTEGQQIRITTNRPTVRGPGDTNLTGFLDWPSAVLWPLMPGVNDIEFQVDNAGASTRIELSFQARYEGA